MESNDSPEISDRNCKTSSKIIIRQSLKDFPETVYQEANVKTWVILQHINYLPGCKIICGTPTTLVVRGLMMTMWVGNWNRPARELPLSGSGSWFWL